MHYTDSETVIHNEDGSWTTKIEYTQFPPTPAQKAMAIGGLVVVTALAFSPLLALMAEERREKKRIKQQEAARKANLS